MATNQDREWAANLGPAAATTRPTVVQPVDASRDATAVSGSNVAIASAATAEGGVRWGAVWAGLLAAFTVFVLLSVLGLAIGLSTINGGTVLATGTMPNDAGRHSSFWLGVAGILSFLIGGYVAGRMAMVFTRGRAALHGSLIFFLAVPLLALLAGLYAGGNLDNLGAAVHANRGLLQTASMGAALRDAAWWTLIGLVVALVASALGGAFGARSPRRYR